MYRTVRLYSICAHLISLGSQTQYNIFVHFSTFITSCVACVRVYLPFFPPPSIVFTQQHTHTPTRARAPNAMWQNQNEHFSGIFSFFLFHIGFSLCQILYNLSESFCTGWMWQSDIKYIYTKMSLNLIKLLDAHTHRDTHHTHTTLVSHNQKCDEQTSSTIKWM